MDPDDDARDPGSHSAPSPDASRPGPPWQRIALWIGVTAIALWLIVSGVSGIIAKGG